MPGDVGSFLLLVPLGFRWMVLVENLLLIRLGGLRPDREFLVHSPHHFGKFLGEVLLLEGVGQQVVEFPRLGFVLLGRYSDHLVAPLDPRLHAAAMETDSLALLHLSIDQGQQVDAVVVAVVG